MTCTCAAKLLGNNWHTPGCPLHVPSQTDVGAELSALAALIEAARQDASNEHWIALLDDVELMTARLAKIRRHAVTSKVADQ